MLIPELAFDEVRFKDKLEQTGELLPTFGTGKALTTTAVVAVAVQLLLLVMVTL